MINTFIPSHALESTMCLSRRSIANQSSCLRAALIVGMCILTALGRKTISKR